MCKSLFYTVQEHRQPLHPLITITLGVSLSLCLITSASSDDRLENRHQLNPHSAIPSLDGSGYNKRFPQRGAVNTPYRRLSRPFYADGIGLIVDGPELRYISNRIFADSAQNLFSESGVTQWAYNWGQFIDHTLGLRGSGTEPVEINFDTSDPLEHFNNSNENLSVTRSAVSPGTGESTAREHLNTVSSYIDAWAVYGGTDTRLEWLREGPVDGDMTNNGAKLLLTAENHLPTLDARGDATSAPVMEIVGQLHALPDAAAHVVVAGDKRANENIALTTVQTLFAREHNRIVDLLPDNLTAQKKFDIARQVVIATQQYITYNEFLPALGVNLRSARRYQPNVDVSVSHEFATVGFRAHSMIHGEIEMEVAADRYSDAELASFADQGIEILVEDGQMELAVPLNVAFANPQLATSLGIGPIAAGLGGEPQYKNDEQIDNQLRSVLFQLPNPDIEDPDACIDGESLNECFLLANDIGVLDVFRARDHGIVLYNELREVYGLRRVSTFAELTGESTEEFPIDDPAINTDDPINDPNILDFIELRDSQGNLLEPGSEAADTTAVTGIRRSTLAARLKAIYGDVDSVDAFVGMISEPHLAFSDLGELQYSIWKTQFTALRDGDPNFYRWNRALRSITRQYGSLGVDYRQTLFDIIVNNTDITADQIQPNMFLTAEN